MHSRYIRRDPFLFGFIYTIRTHPTIRLPVSEPWCKSPMTARLPTPIFPCGEFLDYLRQHTLYDSTLIVAASDHGESFGEHGEYTHGYFLYDTTLLVPLDHQTPPQFRHYPPAGQPTREDD